MWDTLEEDTSATKDDEQSNIFEDDTPTTYFPIPCPDEPLFIEYIGLENDTDGDDITDDADQEKIDRHLEMTARV
jgi:hypothetical protein